jgi:hypothetical protein
MTTEAVMLSLLEIEGKQTLAYLKQVS